MTTNIIDISGPLKTLAIGFAFAILTTLASIVIKFVSNNQVPTGDFITTNVDVQHSYFIENKKKYLAEVFYESNGVTYIVYIYTGKKDVQQGSKLVIEYDNNNHKRCCYESKEYMAQPLDDKTK